MKHHPQRISPIAQPNELAKRLPGTTARIRLRDTGDRDETYLALIRQCPCLKCGLDPCCEAAHVRFNSGAFNKHNGMGKKPADRFAVPLCPQDHRESNDSQHKVGEQAFWHYIGINPLLTATRLYAARGDLVKMRAIVIQTIAERQT
jgi:hypothetical protein